MAVLVQAESNRLLDASFGTATYTAPTTPMKLALVTANGTVTAAGTEVTGGPGPYARQTIAMTSAASGSCSNTALITFAGMPAATIVGLEIWDSNATPRRAWFGPLATSRTTVSGDSVTFSAGSIIASDA